MKNLIMICALVLGSTVANAGAFVEPYLGYNMGKVDGTLVGGLPYEFKSTGTALGVRAGYQFLIPFIALDVNTMKGSLTDSSIDGDISGTDIGVVVGAGMIPIVRPYAGYVFSKKTKVEYDGGGSSEFKGTAMKFGVGIKILPLFNINVEMVTDKYKDVNGVDMDTAFTDFKSTSTNISLSYVF